MSAHSEHKEPGVITRNIVVRGLNGSPPPQEKVIKAMKKAMDIVLEEFVEVRLKENPYLKIIMINAYKFDTPQPWLSDQFRGGVKLGFWDPTPSGSKNTVGDPQGGYRDSDDPQEESPELEDDINEDLGTCDWDGPEECESCQ